MASNSRKTPISPKLAPVLFDDKKAFLSYTRGLKAYQRTFAAPYIELIKKHMKVVAPEIKIQRIEFKDGTWNFKFKAKEEVLLREGGTGKVYGCDADTFFNDPNLPLQHYAARFFDIPWSRARIVSFLTIWRICQMLAINKLPIPPITLN